MEYRCPVCHKTITTSAKDPTTEIPFFPFCCQRCKLIDLGAWLDADYRITSEPHSPNDTNLDSNEEETDL